MDLTVTTDRAIHEPWLSLEPIRIGGAGTIGTPDLFVLVQDGDKPVLRIDVFGNLGAFTEAIAWYGKVVVGFGDIVVLVGLADRSTTEIRLGSYFGSLYPHDDFLLVASGERLFRIEPDGTVAWRTQEIGIDGVVVDDILDGVIHVQGEWDRRVAGAQPRCG